jgi:hypothetical protein
MRWVWEGHLRGEGEEVRDVLLSGAVVGVAVCGKPVFKFDWIWFSRQMLIQIEIIKGSKTILSAMASGEILRLKCMTMEGLVPVDPCLISMFPYECEDLT